MIDENGGGLGRMNKTEPVYMTEYPGKRAGNVFSRIERDCREVWN